MLQRMGAIGLFCLAIVFIFLAPLQSWGAILVCGAVWLFFLPKKNELQAYTFSSLSYATLQESVYAKEISLFVAFGVVCKARVSPFLFGIYIFYLFIDQTHLFNLHFSRFFLLFDEGLHLFLLLVSVFIMSSVTEKTYKMYVGPVRSLFLGICSIVLVGAMALLSVWIVWQATISLGWIAPVVSSLTGCFAVLIGFLLFGAQEENIAR